jgi:hypothetical protein
MLEQRRKVPAPCINTATRTASERKALGEKGSKETMAISPWLPNYAAERIKAQPTHTQIHGINRPKGGPQAYMVQVVVVVVMWW